MLRPSRVARLARRSKEVVADHGVFRVERSDYDAIPRPIFTFDCPDWCNVVAETPEGDVVLVWQYRFGTDALSLEVPGGIVDPGEAPEAAAVRELREETGYEGTGVERLAVVEPNPALQGNRCHTYLVRGARLLHPTAFDETEDLELVLVPRAELPALLDAGTITHALVVSALETYLRRGSVPRSSSSSAGTR